MRGAKCVLGADAKLVKTLAGSYRDAVGEYTWGPAEVLYMRLAFVVAAWATAWQTLVRARGGWCTV